MENQIVWTVVGTLLSGLVATIITLRWNVCNRNFQQKMNVFRTLMQYRYDIVVEENVKAINTIEVFFYKDAKVLNAFENFMEETEKPESMHPQIGDKYLRLLEEIAKNLKLKEVCWDKIKRYYLPKGLTERLIDDRMLKKSAIANNHESAILAHNLNVRNQEEM